jgi:hypothetical protein
MVSKGFAAKQDDTESVKIAPLRMPKIRYREKCKNRTVCLTSRIRIREQKKIGNQNIIDFRHQKQRTGQMTVRRRWPWKHLCHQVQANVS